VEYILEKNPFRRNTPLDRTLSTFKIKINISRHGRKTAFQLRSEEWLTSTVVIKIRYSNFDTETNAGSIHFCRSYFDKKRDGIIRQAIPTSHAVASDWYSI
jgi:DNA polymerase-4